MALKIVESTARVSGAAMDQPLTQRPLNYRAMAIGGLLLLVAVTVVVQLVPRGLRVAASDIRTATVQQGAFQNDVVTRATAAPLHTVILDALEAGRVEEVLVNDGALVEKGQLLYRLSNPQLRLNLVAREADRAQQISNLSNLRVALETSQTDHRRRMLDLKFALAQAQRQHARYAVLAQSGVIPTATLEDAQDRLAQQQQATEDENARAEIEARIKRDGIKKMEQAIQQLDAGLKVVNDSIDALAVRAPLAGRLTDFHLQLGEIVTADQHIGRIDDPNEFKLVAHIDEYYLSGMSSGKKGYASAAGRDYPVEISRIQPQIEEGRFSVELLFSGETPAEMSPGQSLETHITLGETTPGLLLPNDAFLSDTPGSWVFVVERDGRVATRRVVRLGRRNNRQVQVIAGLAAGEVVIVSSYAAFSSSARLQIAR